jgi:hypothetical protein
MILIEHEEHTKFHDDLLEQLETLFADSADDEKAIANLFNDIS